MRHRDDKFVITKCRPLESWKDNPRRWVVWLPKGQRWIQSRNGSTTLSAEGAGVESFEAGCQLVADRLAAGGKRNAEETA